MSDSTLIAAQAHTRPLYILYNGAIALFEVGIDPRFVACSNISLYKCVDSCNFEAIFLKYLLVQFDAN